MYEVKMNRGQMAGKIIRQQGRTAELQAKNKRLKVESKLFEVTNKRLKEEIERQAISLEEFTEITHRLKETIFQELAKNKRLKEAKDTLEWLKNDIEKIETMNEPTFFTICQRWLPHITQALQEKQDD